MTNTEKRNLTQDALAALSDTLALVEKSDIPEEDTDNYDPALLQQALARLAAAAMATEEAVDELADIFATLAVKDYCTAVHRGGQYIAVVESDEMVEEVIHKYDFPTSALPWKHVNDYAAMCGGDDPENFKPSDPEPPGDTNLSQ
jgi:hypothetical protein